MAHASNKPELHSFMQTQFAFAAHIRDPDRNARPDDIEDRRMQIYRELFYNNIESFMADSFPVLRSIMGDDQWHALIRDYFASHKAKTPLFPEMPREFLQYLESEREPIASDPRFLLELAHYEWVELALSLAEQHIDQNTIDRDGDLLEQQPILSQLAWPLEYQYPVHEIGPEHQPDKPGDTPTYIVVYRDRDDEIRFLTINPVTARLLQLLSEQNKLTGRQLLEQIATEINHPDPETVVQGGLSILKDLQSRQIVLGTRLSAAS